MDEKPRPIEPRVPRRSRPPRGTPAPPLGQVRQNPALAFEKVIRGGVGAIPAVWEE
ncbi:MAG: hypothetical protein ACE5IZ_04605 [Dehalococcoidia bacterium]